MMLYPPVADLVNKVGSRYALVNLVAKRARDISAEAEASGEPLTKKAVSSAIEEVYTGKLTINTQPKEESVEEPVLDLDFAQNEEPVLDLDLDADVGASDTQKEE
jgi:DNA-directed RNA polymerase subunit omega